MFGFKKNVKEEKNIPSAEQPGQAGLILRTMQDDVNAFDGKIILKDERTLDDTTPDGTDLETKAPLPKGAVRENNFKQANNNSPFLNNITKQEDAPSKKDVSFLSPERLSSANMPEKRDLPWEEKTKLAQTTAVKKSFRWGKFLTVAFSIIIIVALGFGGYYFWLTREKNKEKEIQTQDVSQNGQPTETPAGIEVPADKFSVDKPNYMVFDTENANAESVNGILRQKAAEVKDSKIEKPIEFIITDANNNPIAFHIFAAEAGISLSSATLSSLDEKFSLYYYNDQGNTRAGIVVDLKDKNELTAALSQEEKKIVAELTPLFLGDSISENINTFSTGYYNSTSIRYVNLNADQTISADYAITDKQFIIGTSKNATWAILDKLGQSSLNSEN